MERNLGRVCRSLVRFGDVEVLGVDDLTGGPLRVHVRCRTPRRAGRGDALKDAAGVPGCDWDTVPGHPERQWR